MKKVILNENEYAAEALIRSDLGTHAYNTLRLVARYFFDCGFSREDVRDRLEKFLLRCRPDASLPVWENALDNAVKRAEVTPALSIDKIDITKDEMEKINFLNGKQLRRLAFTLLFLSKYWDLVSSVNNHWVRNSDTEILSLANVKTAVRRQCAMFRQLEQLGYIRFAKSIDNLSVQVLFGCDGETAIEIYDGRNIGYQYMRYCGEPFIECACCGVTVRVTPKSVGRPRKYCKECASSVAIKRAASTFPLPAPC